MERYILHELRREGPETAGGRLGLLAEISHPRAPSPPRWLPPSPDTGGQRPPARLVGFGTVAPQASWKAALEEIERLAAAGLRGLGEMRPDSQGLFDMASKELAEIAGALRAHRMVLLLHTSEPVGHAYPGKGQATPARVACFNPVEAVPR